MKKFLKSIIPFAARIFPKGKFSQVTFYKHAKNSHLYLCLSKVHIGNEEKFIELFPSAIRISKIEFEAIIFFHSDMKVVTVADENILQELKENEGSYAEDEYEESEDKQLSKD